MTLLPSGNGTSRETAQWSHSFARNPAQAAYIVEITFPLPPRWRVCTKTEAVYYEEAGYQVWCTSGSCKEVFRRREEYLDIAFADQIEEIVDAEHALKVAG